MLNTLDRQNINFRLDGITIDTLGKNLIFQPKTIVLLSCNTINLITTFCWRAALVCHSVFLLYLLKSHCLVWWIYAKINVFMNLERL